MTGGPRASRRRFLVWSAAALLAALATGGLAQPQPGAPEPLRIGVIVPALTGADPLAPLGAELAGEPARRGAILAEEALGGALGGPLDVIVASSPSVEAAERAAHRLIEAQGVVALIGGIGSGQAEALSRIAQQRGVPFLDIGGVAPRSGACAGGTFRVQASAAMYLDALALELRRAGRQRWFFVRAATPEGEAKHRRALAALERWTEVEAVGVAVVPPGQPLFLETFEAIRGSGADAVVLLLEPASQLVFAGQLPGADLDVDVIGFPDLVAQTRPFYAELARGAAPDAPPRRVALWDARRTEHGAGELNERYLSRWGAPMEPSAWAAYAAVAILVQAADATGSTDAGALSAHLASGAAFDVGKGPGTSFRAWDHQLRQPLYTVELQADASTLLEVAAPVAELPSPAAVEGDPVERLDRLGDPAPEREAACP